MSTISLQQEPTEIQKAVSAALEERDRQRHQWEDSQEKMLHRQAKRAKLIASIATILVTFLGGAWGMVVWYGDMRVTNAQKDDEVKKLVEKQGNLEFSLGEHIRESINAHEQLRLMVRDMSLLQLEQGKDQREILLRLLRTPDRKRFEGKKKTLRDLEQRILGR